MSIVTAVILMLLVGIIVGIRSKKLTWTELIVCGMFGLLLGGTSVGISINRAILSGVATVAPTITGWFS